MAFGKRRPLIAALGLSAAIGMGSAALAQDQQFNDEKLQSFAVAALQVQQIVVFAQQQLQAAEAAEDQQAIQAAATAQMEQAIRDVGLSLDDYNEIVTAARQDPEVLGQIQQYVEEQQQ